MTDEAFTTTARTLAVAFLTACSKRQLDRDSVAALTAAAAAETLGQLLGPFGAVERLRDLADVIERQLLH